MSKAPRALLRSHWHLLQFILHLQKWVQSDPTLQRAGQASDSEANLILTHVSAAQVFASMQTSCHFCLISLIRIYFQLLVLHFLSQLCLFSSAKNSSVCDIKCLFMWSGNLLNKEGCNYH